MKIINKLSIIIISVTLTAIVLSCIYSYKIIGQNIYDFQIQRLADRNLGALNEFNGRFTTLINSNNNFKEWIELESQNNLNLDKNLISINEKISSNVSSNFYLLDSSYEVSMMLKENYAYEYDDELNKIINIIKNEEDDISNVNLDSVIATEDKMYIVSAKTLINENKKFKYLLIIDPLNSEKYNSLVNKNFKDMVSIDRLDNEELNKYTEINIDSYTVYVKYNKDNVISSMKLPYLGTGKEVYISLSEKPVITQTFNDCLGLFIVITILILVIGNIFIYFCINRIIVKRMLNISSAVKQIIDTFDLKLRIDEKGKDEISFLCKNLNSLFNLLEKYSNKMAYIAEHDIATKLYNRGKIEEIGQSYIENNEAFCLACIDLDEFKKINDVYGHNVGDQILCQIGSEFLNYSNQYINCGRLGGDEFIILVKDNNNEKITYLVKDILKKFKEGICINGINYSLKLSIGICNYPDFGCDMAQVMKNSDIAMYYIKNSGGNNYCFFHDELLNPFRMETEIEEGLRNGEFEAYFQPIRDLSTNKIVGAEALIRWNKNNTVISPAKFIPVAKRSGYIIELDKLVIIESCKLIREIIDNGIEDFKISVNVSFQLLRQKNFLSELMETIRRYNIGVENIRLEIIENETISELEYIIDLLKRIRACGIQVALDDFGTGYSSFNYIKILPLDVLKLDNSLLYDLGYDKKIEDIIKTIVNLAHILDLTVICEGVETKEQAKLLEELGCDNIQGYYLSKPLKIDKFKSFYYNYMNIQTK